MYAGSWWSSQSGPPGAEGPAKGRLPSGQSRGEEHAALPYLKGLGSCTYAKGVSIRDHIRIRVRVTATESPALSPAIQADLARRAAAVEANSWLKESATLIFVSYKNGAWTPFRSAKDFVKEEVVTGPSHGAR